MTRDKGADEASEATDTTPPDATSSDAAVAEPAQAPAASGALWGFTASMAATLAVVMLLILALVGWALSNQHSANHRQASNVAPNNYIAGPQAVAAETAAANETRATLTYSYKSLASDFAKAAKGLTPAFAANYRSTTASKVTPLATKYHAVSAAVVSDVGVSEISGSTATVLAFVDQTVTNTQLAHPRLDRSRIKITMSLVNGRWLISNLSPL